uniref:NADH-ubiquinone oxidoreductase chain 3 n=1 Tax=Paromalus flavicornis TaxID=154191 RepID=A0A0S2MPD6_9COLE|nr:NADH deshydrogenase subunit 3 [Paromalus flavicornis]
MIMIVMTLSGILMSISLMMMILSSILSKKTFTDREKNSPFECGFDPFNSPRLPFSLQFFLITVIFLIFDVEITLLVPLIMTLKYSIPLSYSMITITFLVILLLGLYHEWKQGALKWSS